MFSLRVTSNISSSGTFSRATASPAGTAEAKKEARAYGISAYDAYVRLLNRIGSDRLIERASKKSQQELSDDIEEHVKEIFPRSTTSPSHNVEEFGERMYEGFFAWVQLSRAAMIVELRHRLGKKRRPAMILDILDRGKPFKAEQFHVRSTAVFYSNYQERGPALEAAKAGYGGFSLLAVLSRGQKVFLRPGGQYNLGAMEGHQWRSKMQRYIHDTVLARLQRSLNSAVAEAV